METRMTQKQVRAQDRQNVLPTRLVIATTVTTQNVSPLSIPSTGYGGSGSCAPLTTRPVIGGLNLKIRTATFLAGVSALEQDPIAAHQLTNR